MRDILKVILFYSSLITISVVCSVFNFGVPPTTQVNWKSSNTATDVPHVSAKPTYLRVCIISDFYSKDGRLHSFLQGLHSILDTNPDTNYLIDVYSVFQTPLPTADPSIQMRVEEIAHKVKVNRPHLVCLLGPIALRELGQRLVNSNYIVISAGIDRRLIEEFFSHESHIQFIVNQEPIGPLKRYLDAYKSDIRHCLAFLNPQTDPVYFSRFTDLVNRLNKLIETQIVYVETYQQLLSWLNQYGYDKTYIISLLVPGLKDASGTILSDVEIARKLKTYKYKATLFSTNRLLCKEGINLCYGPDYFDIGQRVGKFIARLPYMYLAKTSVSSELAISSRVPSRIKIAIINSYSLQDPCGRPQQLGFIYELTKVLPVVDWHIENYYMQTKTVNTTVSQIKAQAQYALDFVNKEVQPDFVFTTDDNAFNYVGTILSHDKYVFFSGLNKPFSFYKELCIVSNVAGVEESLNLDKLFKLVKDSGIPVDTIIIFLSDHPSLTEQGLTSLVLKKANKYKFKYMTLYNSSVEEFVENVKRLNSKASLMLFCPISRLYSFSERKYYSMLQLNKLLVKNNKRHLEFGINPLFCEIGGLSICEGPDFYEMGKLAADMLIKTILTSKFEHKVVRPKSKLVCNYERLHKLGYDFLYDNFSDKFDEIY